MSEDDLDLAVVVLSYGPRPTIADAVRSLLEQDTRAEIVIVHSGGGEPPAAPTNKPNTRKCQYSVA